MSEWQPVRLKRSDVKHTEFTSGVKPVHVPQSYGRIVRARLTDDRVGYTCGAQWIVEIHSDDVRDILGLPVGSERYVTCEHHIQTD